MIPQDPSDISRLRISDADRDRAAEILSNALAEGRLTAEEHSERLDAVYAAKVQADIVPLISDLPAASAAALTLPDVPSGSPVRMVSIFSGTVRKGVWQVPAHLEVVNVFGGTELDLREARLPGREIRIAAYCILGGMEITVPPEMHVIDNGIALLGGRELPPETEESASPGAPVLRVTGLSLLGGLTVRRKPRKGDKPRKQLR